MSDDKYSWPRGYRAAISLTFDDARPSQIERGLPILDRHGMRGTFYVSLKPMERKLEEWKAAVARGHEIGNHSLRHPCSGNFHWSRERALEDYTLAQMEQELRDANEQIQELIGVTPTTFAYPCGQTYVGRGAELQSYIPVVARLFSVGRLFKSEANADPSYCDLAHVPGIDFDGADWNTVKPWIDMVLNNGGWLIFAGHEVGPAGRQTILPDTLERICEFCTDPGNGLWLDTVAAVGAYIRSHRPHGHA